MFRFGNLSKHKVIQHFISDRSGGVSPAPYNTLNIGFNTKDAPENVIKNREILAIKSCFDLNALTTVKQTHSGNVILVNADIKGRGALDYDSALHDADALVTNLRKVPIMVQVADCVPILLFDPVNNVIAAVHAGWRGTLLHIAAKTVEKMSSSFGSDPLNLIAGIGPSIGPCCYEVGKEVVDKAADMMPFIYNKKGKPYFDLWESNKAQLMNSGVRSSNIEVSGICTMDNSDLYFSSRAGKGITGRFAACIELI